MFKGKKSLWSNTKKVKSPSTARDRGDITLKQRSPRFPLPDHEDDFRLSDGPLRTAVGHNPIKWERIQNTSSEESRVTPQKITHAQKSNSVPTASGSTGDFATQISNLAVEVIQVPVPPPCNNNDSSKKAAKHQKQESMQDVSWTTTTNTSSYTVSTKQECAPCNGRVLGQPDLDLLRDFIIKVDGSGEAKKLLDESFASNLLTDQKRGIVNLMFVDAWYMVALVTVLVDKRPWQRHNHARVIEFKILSTHRSLEVVQVIVKHICATASTNRCARIIVHASPEDFQLFASADWVVETKRTSRITDTSVSDITVERLWSVK